MTTFEKVIQITKIVIAVPAFIGMLVIIRQLNEIVQLLKLLI